MIEQTGSEFITDATGAMTLIHIKDTNACEDCGESLSEKALNRKDEGDVTGAADHCKEHLMRYPGHSIKPIWCESCGQLEMYQIKLIKHMGGSRRAIVKN